MREDARAVVIGGGVGGCSILYHLAKLGWKDVVLVEQYGLTHGSTWHSAGLVGQLRSTVSLTKMMQYSVGLYADLARETGKDPGLARARRPAARVLAGALRGDPAPGRLGQELRPPDRDRLAGRGEEALPADVDRRRRRRGVPAAGRLPRPQPAHVRPGRRGAPAGRRDRAAHARARGDRRGRPLPGRRHRQGHDPGRRGRERRRDVRASDRPDGRCRGADHPVRARVPRHRGVRPAAPAAARPCATPTG